MLSPFQFRGYAEVVVETFTKNNNAVNGQTPYLFRFPNYFEHLFSPSVAVNPEGWNHSLGWHTGNPKVSLFNIRRLPFKLLWKNCSGYQNLVGC